MLAKVTYFAYLEILSLLGYLFLGIADRCLALNCRASSYVSLVRPVRNAFPIPEEYSFWNWQCSNDVWWKLLWLLCIASFCNLNSIHFLWLAVQSAPSFLGPRPSFCNVLAMCAYCSLIFYWKFGEYQILKHYRTMEISLFKGQAWLRHAVPCLCLTVSIVILFLHF